MRVGIPAIVVLAVSCSALQTVVPTTSRAHAAGEALITVTINPEARVSVERGADLPAPIKCGVPAEVAVRVINLGLVTAQLEATLVENVPDGASISLQRLALTGAPEEIRTLRIVLARSGVTDLTVAFHLRNEKFELGGRSRAHWLLSCQ